MEINYILFKYWKINYDDISKVIKFNEKLLYTEYTLCSRLIPTILKFGYNFQVLIKEDTMVIYVNKGNFTQS